METEIEVAESTIEKEETRAAGWVKILLIVFGSLFVGLGVLGILLPVLPTTPFLLLAAACYARSSQRFYCWLLNNRLFGRYINDYRCKRGMPLKLKIMIVFLMWLTITLSAVFVIESVLIRVMLAVIATGVSIHILSIKAQKN